jgi:hypothetical protein
VVTAYSASGTTLVDILDRVLDKGLVVAGDIKISLANVELLTIKIRLLVCSIDKAEQIGLNWWRYDQSLVHPEEPVGALPEGAAAVQVALLEARIAELERQLAEQQVQQSALAGSTRRASATASGGGAEATPPRRRRRRTE